jgi:hypothetical protein
MSESLATRGYIAPLGGSPLPSTINVIAVTVTATYLDIQFSVPVVLAAYGQDATNWTIASVSGVFYPTTPTGVFSASADTIRLLVDEMTNAATFSLDLVVGLVESMAHDASNMQESWTFTGVGITPQIVSVASQSAKTVLVTFDKPMHGADLALTAKFYPYGPVPLLEPLGVTAAGGQSDRSSLLTTNVALAGAEYGVMSSCRSRAGNAGVAYLTPDQMVVLGHPNGLYLMDDTFGTVLTDSGSGNNPGIVDFGLTSSGPGHAPGGLALYSNGANAIANIPNAFRPGLNDPWSFEFYIIGPRLTAWSPVYFDSRISGLSDGNFCRWRDFREQGLYPRISRRRHMDTLLLHQPGRNGDSYGLHQRCPDAARHGRLQRCHHGY